VPAPLIIRSLQKTIMCVQAPHAMVTRCESNTVGDPFPNLGILSKGVEVPSSVSADPKSMQNCAAWCCFTCVISSQWGRPPGGSPLPMSSEMMGVDHGFVGGIRVPGPRRSQRLQISGSQIKRSATRHSIWVSLKISCPQIRWLTIG